MEICQWSTLHQGKSYGVAKMHCIATIQTAADGKTWWCITVENSHVHICHTKNAVKSRAWPNFINISMYIAINEYQAYEVLLPSNFSLEFETLGVALAILHDRGESGAGGG